MPKGKKNKKKYEKKLKNSKKLKVTQQTKRAINQANRSSSTSFESITINNSQMPEVTSANSSKFSSYATAFERSSLREPPFISPPSSRTSSSSSYTTALSRDDDDDCDPSYSIICKPTSKYDKKFRYSCTASGATFHNSHWPSFTNIDTSSHNSATGTSTYQSDATFSHHDEEINAIDTLRKLFERTILSPTIEQQFSNSPKYSSEEERPTIFQSFTDQGFSTTTAYMETTNPSEASVPSYQLAELTSQAGASSSQGNTSFPQGSASTSQADLTYQTDKSISEVNASNSKTDAIISPFADHLKEVNTPTSTFRKSTDTPEFPFEEEGATYQSAELSYQASAETDRTFSPFDNHPEEIDTPIGTFRELFAAASATNTNQSGDSPEYPSKEEMVAIYKSFTDKGFLPVTAYMKTIELIEYNIMCRDLHRRGADVRNFEFYQP